ncbi:MAG: DUF2493 domain-containing protein [Alphaproteobacteria bacterium]|nr:DUF2493 domain-containing protein [Alphaproteobacteria bacterium]
MKIIVCGGSRFQDKQQVFDQLDALHAQTPLTLIVNGGARGADLFSSQWARERGVALARYQAFPSASGRKQAFCDLNRQMLAEHTPDLVLAFPGGAVTADLVARAEEAGIPVAHAGR